MPLGSFISYQYNEGLASIATILRKPVAFRYSSGGEVVMPSHSPREGGWLALCLPTSTVHRSARARSREALATGE